MLLLSSNTQRLSLRKISVILLVALLCSFISHTFEHEVSLGVSDKQDCQLCQHNIDAPKQVNLLTEYTQTRFSFVVQKNSPVCFVNQYFYRPVPRGPPAIDKLFT